MASTRGRSGVTTAELDKRLSLLEAQLQHHATKADLTQMQTSVEKNMRDITDTMEENRLSEHTELKVKFDKLERDFNVFQTEITTSMKTMRIFIMTVMVIVTIIGELIALGVINGGIGGG